MCEWLFAWLDLVLGFALVGFEVVGGCFGAGARDPSWWGLCWAGVLAGLCWYLVLVLFVLGCFGWCLVCGVCGCLWGLACGVLGFGFRVGWVLAPACGWLLSACWYSDLVCLDGLLPVLVSRGVDIIHIV